MLPHLPLDSHDMPVLNLFLYCLNCLSVSGLCVYFGVGWRGARVTDLFAGLRFMKM